jgi:hypothetical protein
MRFPYEEPLRKQAEVDGLFVDTKCRGKMDDENIFERLVLEQRF